MRVYHLWMPVVVTLSLLSAGPSWQAAAPSSTEATAFLGTWVIAMTNPAGATETVRIWEDKGALAASVQAGRSSESSCPRRWRRSLVSSR